MAGWSDTGDPSCAFRGESPPKPDESRAGARSPSPTHTPIWTWSQKDFMRQLMLHTHLLLLSFSRSVMSDSLWPYGLQPTRLLYPWDSPGALPDPEIEPRSPALQADSLPSEPSGKKQFPIQLNLLHLDGSMWHKLRLNHSPGRLGKCLNKLFSSPAASLESTLGNS